MAEDKNISVQYESTSQRGSAEILDFLMPFMRAGFLLQRKESEIERLKEHGFAAIRGDELVGFAAVEFYSSKLAELQCLAVDSNFRGQGIGKSLVGMCCEVASKVGVRELMAISASDEMFKACGFDYSLPNQKKALFFQARTLGQSD